MSEPSILETDFCDGVLLLTLNRPERRNALSLELSGRLREAFLAADVDPSVAVIAVTGTGAAFCSGADLKEARRLDEDGGRFQGPLHRPERSLYEVMIDCRKPIVALVNGPAVAGGFELALACDLRVAASGAVFALPEALRGMGAHFASVLLPQIVPAAIAMEWMLTGRNVSVVEAERWGLLNAVTSADHLMQTGMDLARRVAASAPLSLQRMKLTYRKTFGMPLHAAIRLEPGPDPYSSEDRKEGARAFLEKRNPVWQGR